MLSAGVALLSAGCEEDPAADPCASGANPSVELGKGVGGAFTAYEDGEGVGLAVAPQGGFGVTVVITTEGLAAGSGSTADILMDVEVDGVNDGSFFLEGAALLCEAGVGGRFDGAVVGFDSDKYSSNDDLLSLDGRLIDLVVTVTDVDGNEATARQPVTLNVGNGG
ncbi:MAG: hypothetical protein AAF799_30150 [Myxococcota bacterium]